MNNTELIDRLTRIIEDSDERMRKTNDMVNQLTSTLNKITEEYARHLESLRVCRDNQIKIIDAQTAHIVRLQEDLRNATSRYEGLVDKLLLRPNVNVSQS